jgi:hypothetical protein
LLSCPEKSGLKQLSFTQQEYLALYVASRLYKQKPLRGRPKKEDARRIAMSLAVSDQERQDIHSAAQRRGVSVADFMRDAIGQAMEQKPVTVLTI